MRALITANILCDQWDQDAIGGDPNDRGVPDSCLILPNNLPYVRAAF